MPIGTDETRLVRFAGFELDLDSGELRRGGRPVRIQRQPSKVLAKLAANPGKLVSRDELRHEVWDGTTFVDFEQGLNFCIRRIRAALGDDAESPRFIETVPRCGYRFIAQIEPAPIVSTAPSEVPGTGHKVSGKTGIPDLLKDVSVRRKSVALSLIFFLASILVLWEWTRPETVPRVVRIVPVTNDGQQKLTNTPYDFQSPMVSDGSRLFFEEQISVHSAIAEVTLTGGETELLKTPFRSVQLAGISPDNSHLLVANMYSETATDVPFYSLKVIGGTAQRLGDFVGHDAAWSPTGELLAFGRKDELDVAGKDGTLIRKLVSGIGLPWWPRWSPDGKRIRFTVADPKTQSNSIWEVGSDGSGLRRVFAGISGPSNECCGSWTPDSKYFVFEATRDDTAEIWVHREQTSYFHPSKLDSIQLTSGPMQAYAPMPSADGRRIYVIGAKRRSELVLYNAKNKNFEPFQKGLSASEVGFSEDGQSIAYVQYPERTLWRARADGTERLKLTTAPLEVWLPRWSPDAKWIAFFGGLPGQPWKVYLIASSGGSPKELLAESAEEGDPSWSPDGHSLAFGRLPWKTGVVEESRIYSFNLNTSKVHTVDGSEGLFSPRWSPTGEYLMATKADSTAILVFSSATQKWRVLATGLLNYASWSRDGKYIYAVDSHLRGMTTVVRIRVSDAKAETVADLSNLKQISTGWVGIDARDAPLVAQEIGTEEIYALEWNVH